MDTLYIEPPIIYIPPISAVVFRLSCTTHAPDNPQMHRTLFLAVWPFIHVLTLNHNLFHRLIRLFTSALHSPNPAVLALLPHSNNSSFASLFISFHSFITLFTTLTSSNSSLIPANAVSSASKLQLFRTALHSLPPLSSPSTPQTTRSAALSQKVHPH